MLLTIYLIKQNAPFTKERGIHLLFVLRFWILMRVLFDIVACDCSQCNHDKDKEEQNESECQNELHMFRIVISSVCQIDRTIKERSYRTSEKNRQYNQIDCTGLFWHIGDSKHRTDEQFRDHVNNGVPEGNWTHGHRLRRLVLYPGWATGTKMALPKGIEPLAYRLGGGRSNPGWATGAIK